MKKLKRLFIHGWATDDWVWKEMARTLSPDNDCLHITLPGHGNALNWDKPTLAPALKEVERIIANEPDGSITGFGWSLGAQILLASVSRDPRKWNGLVLVAATPRFVASDDFPHGQSKTLLRRLLMDLKKDPAGTLKRFYKLNFTEDELDGAKVAEFLKRYEYPGPMNCAGKIPGCFPAFNYTGITVALEALYNTDIRSGLPVVGLPVLIIHGTADLVTPFSAGEYLAQALRGATLMAVKDAGHAPHLTHKDEVLIAINEFLKGL